MIRHTWGQARRFFARQALQPLLLPALLISLLGPLTLGAQARTVARPAPVSGQVARSAVHGHARAAARSRDAAPPVSRGGATFPLPAGPRGTPPIPAFGHALAPDAVGPPQVTGSAEPQGIASGPDGKLWFTEYAGNAIGAISPSGSIGGYGLPTAGSDPVGIALGPDGNLWFTEFGGNRIGKITTAGALTEYSIPTANSQPYDIAAGPDGNLWFAESGTNKIAKVTTGGTFTEYAVPTAASSPQGIAAGPDGNLWFTEASAGKIGRITTGGSFSEFPLPSGTSEPIGIAAGPDGKLWFAEYGADKIGKILPASPNTITEYGLPTAASQPVGIAAGPDGALWFTEYSGNNIGRITTPGSIIEIAISPAGSGPVGIASGPDGQIWYTAYAAGFIGVIYLPAASGTVPWHPSYEVGLAAGLSVRADLFDGHADVRSEDLAIPGRGPDLALAHTWDSTLAADGVVTSAGQGWVTNLLPGMAGGLTGTVSFGDATGANWNFDYLGAATDPGPVYTTYTSPPGQPWQLSTNSASSTVRYTLTDILTGEVLTFDPSGRLVADTDTYGNSNAPAYVGGVATGWANSGGRSVAVSYSGGLMGDVQSPLWRSTGGAQGQHVTYSYGPGTGCVAGQLCSLTRGSGTGDALTDAFGYSGTQLSSVTTPMGHQWTLGYDGNGRLATITSPISGTVGQAGYTPAYTTQISYNPETTMVVRGYGSTAPLTTTYTLDGQGEAIAVADGLGDTSHATYDPDHDVLTGTDPNGNRTTSAYQYIGSLGSTGLISQTVGPPVGVNSISLPTSVQITTTDSYDPNYNLTDTKRGSIGGGLGSEETQYTYDAHHGLLTTAELLGTTTSGTGCPQAVQQGAFPAPVQPDQAQVQPLTCTTLYQWRGSLSHYNGYGQLDYTVDGRGLTTGTGAQANVALNTAAGSGNYANFQRGYGYNGSGDQTTASTPPILTSACPSTPCAATTTTGYDGDGEATSVQSANGNTTTTVFNHLGQATQTLLPAVTLFDGTVKQPTTTTAYDGDGNVRQVTDPDLNVTRSSYDPLQRLVSRIDPTGGMTLNAYSATNLTGTTDPRLQTSTRSYDAAGRPSKSVDPSGNYTTTQYDSNSNPRVTSGYSAAGALLTTDTKVYDSMDWVTSDTASGPATASEQTQYAYDIDGNAILEQDANGEWHQFIYDGASQQIDTTISTSGLAVLNEEQDTYDLAGNQYFTISMDGQSHTDSLDGDNRTTQSVDVTAGGTTTITTTAGFDPDGNTVTRHIDEIVGGAHQAHTYSATFNQADWRTQTVDDVGQPDILTTAYGYDAAGQQRSETATGAQTPVRSTLDNQGRTTAIGESVGGTTAYTGTFGYDGNGDLTTIGLPASTTAITGTYDANSRLQQLDLTGPTGVAHALNSHYSYGYDGLSRTSAITGTVNGAVTASYPAHDALGRLTGDGAGQSFTYQPDGNLGTAVSGATTSTYSYANSGQPDELTSLATTGKATLYYGYDNGGTRGGGAVANSGGETTIISTNATLGTDCTGALDPSSTCLGYDAQGRLQAATMPDGSKVVLAYNAAGQRASYTATPNGAGQPSLLERFTYRGGELAQAGFSGTGVTTPYTDTYLYRQDGAPYELIRQTKSTGACGSATCRYWYLLDGRGNVVGLADKTGNVVDRYHYVTTRRVPGRAEHRLGGGEAAAALRGLLVRPGAARPERHDRLVLAERATLQPGAPTLHPARPEHAGGDPQLRLCGRRPGRCDGSKRARVRIWWRDTGWRRCRGG